MSMSPSDQQAIIQLCEEHEQAHQRDFYYNRCVVFGQRFIKYGHHTKIYYQYKTQEYLFNQSVGDPNAPRIPAVLEYFTHEDMVYLVTELIDPIMPASDSPEAVAGALRWLHRVPAPSGHILGSVGGGNPRHILFKNYEAPYIFSSTQALQNYMNRALDWIPPKGRPAKMDFLEDALIFTQSDMHITNFALDKDNKICMFDFEDVGVLPECFARFTLTSSRDPFLARVAECLGWTKDSNSKSLGGAGSILIMISDSSLGLDMHGNVKPKVRKSPQNVKS
ncbi:hypothetical protein M413DRAFT_445852 [Hebeloma cylindrosporum]|uniref:Aminoglycoside phosphotransferase domain-containing protein n=1 Tax=Hebeloma cylindrosporum TaxID=76867 RepID=A0A0C3CAA3_HEBCY|nr:hypothetical protein M413DRAFT_445852 [Hebeloma cylindrosporum h7]